MPVGTKWERKKLILLSDEKIIYPNHKGKAILTVIDKCLVAVKIYGNSPKKLEHTINKNIEIKIKESPGVTTLPIDNLNSPFKIFINILYNLIFLLFNKKNFWGKYNINKNIATQFKLYKKIEDTGSNTEKREFIK